MGTSHGPDYRIASGGEGSSGRDSSLHDPLRLGHSVVGLNHGRQRVRWHLSSLCRSINFASSELIREGNFAMKGNFLENERVALFIEPELARWPERRRLAWTRRFQSSSRHCPDVPSPGNSSQS